MAAHSLSVSTSDQKIGVNPVRLAAFTRMRALAWCNDVLYASRGYTLLRARMNTCTRPVWENVGIYRPTPWRIVSSSFRLASRLFRDGFHALVALSSGSLIAAVPHTIVTLSPGEAEFRV